MLKVNFRLEGQHPEMREIGHAPVESTPARTGFPHSHGSPALSIVQDMKRHLSGLIVAVLMFLLAYLAVAYYRGRIAEKSRCRPSASDMYRGIRR